jgi:ABC-2 type transport system permease protein
MAVISGVLGSIAHNVASLLDSPSMAAIIAKLGGAQGLTDAFLAAEMGMIGTVAAAYGIVAVSRLRAEEAAGHAELLLAGVPGRRRLAASHAVIALAGVAGLLLVVGVAAGVGHAVAIGDPSQVTRVAAAGCARIPAAWVVVGLVMLVWGAWPRATSAVWALYVAFLLVGELGAVWGLPQAVIDLSPFAHSPLLPGNDVGLTGLGWLSALALVLVVAGIGAFRRRDLTP